jgi:hypothetical protein
MDRFVETVFDDRAVAVAAAAGHNIFVGDDIGINVTMAAGAA